MRSKLLVELLKLLATTGNSDVKIINMEGESEHEMSDAEKQDFIRALTNKKQPVQESLNEQITNSPFSDEIKAYLTTSIDWVTNQTNDDQKNALLGLKRCGLTPFAALYLVRDHGYTNHDVCLLDTAQDVATKRSYRDLARNLMHDFDIHGMRRAGLLALDWNDYQTDMEIRYKAANDLCVAKFGDDAAFPGIEKIDLADSAEFTKKLKDGYDAIILDPSHATNAADIERG